MARFGWASGHAKQGSDKSQYLPQEWFSKSTIEPSRQALGQMRKDLEDGGETSPTISPNSRSRSGTVSSILSSYAKSSSDRSNDGQVTPPSRQSMIQEAAQEPAHTETTNRSLFSKGGRMLRRQGSKLTLGPSPVENGLVVSGLLDFNESSLPKRGLSSKSSRHRFNSVGSPLGSDMKANISGPFGFQHVSHTDQGHFHGLKQVSKLDLVEEFTAVQEGQTPAGEIRGIAVSELPSSTDKSFGSGASFSPSPTSSIIPDLPSTPPRPAPPPKDSLPPPKTPDVRFSRSMENFSRPTRSPIASGFQVSPVPEHTASFTTLAPASVLETIPQSPSGWAEETVDRLTNVSTLQRQSVTAVQTLDKPLPQPPTVVHAVSTNDESALPLRNTPLPELPQISAIRASGTSPVQDGFAAQTTQIPHRVSLRHAQSFPTAKPLRRRSQSSGEIPFASSFAAPTSYTSSSNKAKCISIGISKIDIEDWESAIDYAWDHPLDMGDVGVPAFDRPDVATQTPPSRPESFLVVRQPPSEPTSQPATPLMMQAPNKPLPTPDLSKRLSSLHRPPSKLSLQGLGIASTSSQPQFVSQAARLSRDIKRESFIMPLYVPTIPAIRREPGSPMSKSSSQESIILSIASSIMGTHRSSNSSTSLGDLSNLASIEDEKECKYSNRDLQSTTHDGVIARSSDVSCWGGNTSDSSQVTVKTDAASIMSTQAPPPQLMDYAPISPQKRARTTSIPHANVPNRTSSIAASTTTKSPAARARSNTVTNRPRYHPSRASYSLFPTAQPLPPSLPTSTTI